MTETTIPTELAGIKDLANIINDEKALKLWVFTHTKSEEDYYTFLRALRLLTGVKFVEWYGKTGSRHHRELEA